MSVGQDFRDLQKKNGKKEPSWEMQCAIDNSGLFKEFDKSEKHVKKIEAFIKSMEKLKGDNPKGYGDEFKDWCARRGRELPSDDAVRLLNINPYEGRQAVRNDTSHPLVYRSLVTFIANVGRR